MSLALGIHPQMDFSLKPAVSREVGFPGGSDGKESACSAGDLGWENPQEEGMTTPSSFLAWRIPMDRGGWWVAKSQT